MNNCMFLSNLYYMFGGAFTIFIIRMIFLDDVRTERAHTISVDCTPTRIFENVHEITLYVRLSTL